MSFPRRLPACDLRNRNTFPAYDELPVEGTRDPPFYRLHKVNGSGQVEPIRSHHWCFLGQIVQDRSVGARTVLTVKDGEGKHVPVVLYFDHDLHKQIHEGPSIRVGRVIIVLYAEQHRFTDGKRGIHIDEPGYFQIFPCDLKTLIEINDSIERETPTNCAQRCQRCGKEDHPDNIALQRCARCHVISYCGKDCQTNDWRAHHKNVCKIVKSLSELKKNRNWTLGGFTRSLKLDEVDERTGDGDLDYMYKSHWSRASPAIVKSLQSTFTVESGELVWGHLPCLIVGMNTRIHDGPALPDSAQASSSRTITHSQSWTFRVPARSGIWKLAQVNGTGIPKRHKDSWLAYHSDENPVNIVSLARDGEHHPRVASVNRHDWGYHFFGEGSTARTLAAVDPESGWRAAVERERRLRNYHKRVTEGHPDFERWNTLDEYRYNGVFLVDALYGAEVLKLVARPSELDAQIKEKKSVSLDSRQSRSASFGCRLAKLGEEDQWDSETARMVFSKEDSIRFPGKKELVAFWYTDLAHYGHEPEGGSNFMVPIVENIP